MRGYVLVSAVDIWSCASLHGTRTNIAQKPTRNTYKAPTAIRDQFKNLEIIINKLARHHKF